MARYSTLKVQNQVMEFVCGFFHKTQGYWNVVAVGSRDCHFWQFLVCIRGEFN